MDNRGRSGQVNHILYADDALVFCEASIVQVRNLAATLICFECVTGLKVNFHKSSMFTVGTVLDADFLARSFGCQLESLPSLYLGLPLGARSSNSSLWDPVVANMERKLETWKARFLSFGGRLTLIKSVLSSLPVYYMSLLKAPCTVIMKLEGLQKRFLWSGTSDSKKLHWINWDTIKCHKNNGGLGVQDLRILNEALLCKWSWRYATERAAWWRGLITTKCGTGPSEWYSSWNFASSGCSMWKGAISYSSLFWTYGSIEPGGGMCAFWYDYWVRGVRLYLMFPRISAAAQSLDTLVANVCSFSDRWVWSIPLRFQLRGGALEEWNNLLDFLAALPPDFLTEGPPSITWPLQANGCFTVASLRKELGSIKFGGLHNFPYKVIWQSFIPSKITSFCWKVFHKKIATVDNLQRKGFLMANRCVMCLNCSESVDNLFLHCAFASRVWSLLSSKLSFHGPFPSDMRGFISAWKGMNCVSRFAPARKAILHAVLWFIWKERNARIFKDSTNSHSVVVRNIWFATGDWLSSSNQFSSDVLLLWRRLVFDNG
ncbi:Putative ribonuclease H protein At1g65750 [Linum perenne]